MNAMKQMQDVFMEMKHYGQPEVPKYSLLKVL
jgi:hypothetical protein